VLFALVYVFGCNPKVCYITGIDGLEPVRAFSFFLAEGLALSVVGFSEKNQLTKKSDISINKIAIFYSVAYYPVIFTIAGTKLVSQISPASVIAIVALLSFATSASVLERTNDRRLALFLPALTFLALVVISIGVASQYINQILLLLSVLFATVVATSIIGTLFSFKVSGIVRSKFFAIGLIGFVLLVNVAITPDAVNGTAPNLNTNSYYLLNPVFVGAFMSSPSIGTKGVAANFTFQGTNTSSIQQDNFIAVGIGVHSPNCCVDGIDYGYRADVFLYRNSTKVFATSAWEVCDDIIACGGHPWKDVIFFSSGRVNVSLDDNFRLSMEWQENHTVAWFLNDNNVSRLIASFLAPEQENPGFNVGYLGSLPPPSIGGVPFFQFGVMSFHPIDQTGWKARVSCPAILVNTTWTCATHAELLQGDQSYWKAIWRWGEPYSGVGATVNPQTKEITFQYSQTPLVNFQQAW